MAGILCWREVSGLLWDMVAELLFEVDRGRVVWSWLSLLEEAWLLSLVEDRQGADTPWLGHRQDWREAEEPQGIPGHRAGGCWVQAEGSPSGARWWWGEVSVSGSPSVLHPRSSACNLGHAPEGL